MFTDSTGNEDFGPYLSLLGGGLNAQAQFQSGNSTAALLRANAGIAGLQAQSELQKGAQQTQIYQTHLAQTIGRQTAQVGGSGVTMSGSPLRALENTQEFGAQDIQRIQLNAAKSAWGFDTTQAGDQMRASLAQQSGTLSGIGSLITSGARAYGQWSFGG